MKNLFYIIFLVLFLISCNARDKYFLSPDFDEIRQLMQTDPETALSRLQSLSHLETQKLNNSATQNLRNLEFSILLAEALYKNYLPQSNFDDIKAIVEHIEKEETIPDYLCAKAHYYHAVGLSERNDITGACEHYLKALEYMSETKTKDYDKTRFIFLIYTRLGELFLSEEYCDIAIDKFRHALKYAKQLNNNSIANILKLIGNTYQLTGNTDSSLFYFNESLKASSNDINKLDIEKNIAQILFDNGDKDSAYAIIKNNLNKIDDYSPKYSYYSILGEFYYHEKQYDSAIYYLERGFEDQHFYIKFYTSVMLSEIYDSLQNDEKKTYYDNIISQLSIKKINKSTEETKLQKVYDEYKERRKEKEALTHKKKIYIVINSFVILAIIIIISIRLRYKYNQKKLLDTLTSKEKTISEFKEKLKIKNKKLSEMTKKTSNKTDFESYYNSGICQKILNKKSSDFTMLTEGELALLLEAADINLGNLTKTLKDKYPKLKKDDLYYICLILLNVEKNKFQYLLGRNRKTIWDRLNKIKNIMNIGENEDLHIFIKNIILH